MCAKASADDKPLQRVCLDPQESSYRPPCRIRFCRPFSPNEADRAIAELSGKEILERKVSVQLARKPEPAGEKTEGANGEGSGAEGSRRRASGRGRGRGRGRGGRGGRGGRATGVSLLSCLTLVLQQC